LRIDIAPGWLVRHPVHSKVQGSRSRGISRGSRFPTVKDIMGISGARGLQRGPGFPVVPPSLTTLTRRSSPSELRGEACEACPLASACSPLMWEPSPKKKRTGHAACDHPQVSKSPSCLTGYATADLVGGRGTRVRWDLCDVGWCACAMRVCPPANGRMKPEGYRWTAANWRWQLTFSRHG